MPNESIKYNPDQNILPEQEKPAQLLESPATMEEEGELVKIARTSKIELYRATAEDLKRIKAEQPADIFKKILALVIDYNLPWNEIPMLNKSITAIQNLIEIKNKFADEFNINAFYEEQCENLLKRAQNFPKEIIFLVNLAKFRQQTNQIIDIDYQRLSQTYQEPIKQAYRFHLVNNNQDFADLIKQELGQGLDFSEYDQSENIPATLQDAILANQLDKTTSMLIKANSGVKQDMDALAQYRYSANIRGATAISLFRGVASLLAMLSLKNKDGKQFADDVLQYGNEISAQGITSDNKIKFAFHNIFDEGCTLKVFFTLAPFLHKKLIKLGLSPKQAVGTEINWAKSATDNFNPNKSQNYNKIIALPGLEKWNEAYTSSTSSHFPVFSGGPSYSLSKPGDASFKFSDQEAERLIKEHPEIFGEFTEDQFKKAGFKN